MSMGDATATVVQIIFAQLIDDGVLRRQAFEEIASDCIRSRAILLLFQKNIRR
ncbi:hypothetical protein [Sphingomonas endolithica]|uniref:hypothetical protein n=1 Tax=Sphingomonas endolithica TaxID=2972485 RepID=UPI0021AE881E|nr:hypothetical protein [Sphingomonas sp. ZFBP2030]